MNCNVIAIRNFRKEAKRLIKKYPSLKDELSTLQESLEKDPYTGTLITENVYKIRVAVKSKGRGKSGGLRVITHVLDMKFVLEQDAEENLTVFLLSIYDKSELQNISDNMIVRLKDEALDK